MKSLLEHPHQKSSAYGDLAGLCVRPAWARQLKQTRREHGRTTPLKMGGTKVFKIDMQHLAQPVESTPDATIEELRTALIAKSDVRIASSAVWKVLRRLNVSYKKNALRQRAESRGCRAASS